MNREVAVPAEPDLATTAISIEQVTRTFGDHLAVSDLSLDIYEGEFFSLLGPSGCGKTTLLRMLAGFLTPDSGTIRLRGETVTHLPPNKRRVNMVFQHYELFPHMSVFENVAYGLKRRKVAKKEIAERVHEMLEVVSADQLSERRASQLSGGQQQRVALARALVNRPAVLLLDEPLSALDVKLRKRMQLELKSIQHDLGTTFVYVTHDQDEALLMSDRIGVMNDGVLLQVGHPRTIYDQPADAFVADFVGTLNEIALPAGTRWTGPRIEIPGAGHIIVGSDRPLNDTQTRVAVRPERITIDSDSATDQPNSSSSLVGTVRSTDFIGSVTRYVVSIPTLGDLVVHVLSRGTNAAYSPGDPVHLGWPSDASIALAGSSGSSDDQLRS